MGKVYIAGAGPGDKGCLTLKVKDIIQKADIILYDNLVSDEIISLAKPDSKLVDVGKIAGFHKVNQENTNKYLIEYSKKYDIVLRLKGGDPFVFGRGAEEALELYYANVDFEIMQGVSSVTSVPESVGIPITHRDFASSFYVITGKKKKDKELDKEDYYNMSKLKDTSLIFMMSIKNANLIAKNLIEAGKDKNTPSTIISNGTNANEKLYKFTLEQLSQIEDTDIFEMPGILIVGEVTNLSDKLNFKVKKPLNGKRIIINVPKEKGDRFEKRLYDLGAKVLNLSTNYLEKSYDKKEFKAVFDNIKDYEYICFTSSYCVDIFFELLFENSIDIRVLSNLKFAAVGNITAQSLKNKNIIPDIMPQYYSGLELAKKLIDKKADNILCILPQEIDSDLYNELIQKGINVKRLDIYKKKSTKVKLYREKKEDIYAFTSSSSVEGLVNSYNEDYFKDRLAYCIGKTTSSTAEKYGFKTIISENANLDSLIDCIVKHS